MAYDRQAGDGGLVSKWSHFGLENHGVRKERGMKDVCSRLALAVVLVVMASGVASTSAYADTMPAPSAFVHGDVTYTAYGLPGPQYSGSGPILFSDCLFVLGFKLGCESSSVSMGYSAGDGFVSVSGHGDTGIPSGVSGSVEYHMLVQGPGNQTAVVQAHVNTSVVATSDHAGQDYASADAGAFVDGNGGLRYFTITENCFNDSCHASTSPSPDLLFTVPTGDFIVGMVAEGFTDGGTFAATVDPMITFAPGFDSTGWTLEFSPDLPGTTVPEPSGLLLLGVGILGLGIFQYRRRGSASSTVV